MAGNPIVIDHPLVQHKLALMRDRQTTDALFRQLVRETALLLAYEVTRDLPLTTRRVETPLAAIAAPMLPNPKPVLVSILRAGNTLVAGLLELMPFAAVGHVGIYREHGTLEAVEYYFKVPPDVAERQLIVADPMLATGNTAVAAVSRLKGAGARDLRFMCLLAAPEGIAALTAAHPDLAIYTAAVDERLDERGYIVPGLGDAGDRIYGTD